MLATTYSSSAEVASRAAQATGALFVDDRSAVLSSLRNTCTSYKSYTLVSIFGNAFHKHTSWLRWLLLVVAFSIASLATRSAVQVLILDIILGAAVAGRRAAAVEVAIGSRARAGNAALSVTADVDLGDFRGETSCGRLAGGGLQSGRGLGTRGARGALAGELLEAGGRIAVGSAYIALDDVRELG